MLSEKLANDIAQVAMNKLQTKTAGIGKSLRDMALLGAGVGAYAYAPELVSKADDYMHEGEDLLSTAKRRALEAGLGAKESVQNAAAYVPYKTKDVALSMLKKHNPNFDDLHYYGNVVRNRGEYEGRKLLNGLEHRAALGSNFLNTNFPDYFNIGGN